MSAGVDVRTFAMTSTPDGTPAEALTDFLKDRVGDHLRSVLRYDEDGGEFLYLRDDVAEQYSEAEMKDVVRDVRLESVDKRHQEASTRTVR